MTVCLAQQSLIMIGSVVGAIIILVAGWILLRPWFMSLIGGAGISLAQLTAMSFRGVNRTKIVSAKIMAVQAGLSKKHPAMGSSDSITTDQLEAHLLAGGDVKRVVMALIVAQRGNVALSFEKACSIDLSGTDVVEEARRLAQFAPDQRVS